MISENIASMEMPTTFGVFNLWVWKGERGRELVALSTPGLDASKEVMLRVHSECLSGDLFHSLTCDCGPQKDLALKKIQEHGNGIFIYHRQEGRNAGLFTKVQGYNLTQIGMDTHEAYLKLAGHPDPREYSEVLTVLNTILADEKSTIRLLTNNPYKALFLERHGYTVAVEPLRAGASIHNTSYTEAKTQKFLHNTVGYGPYTSVTLSLADIQEQGCEIASFIKEVNPRVGSRKLFIGVSLPSDAELKEPKVLADLKRFYNGAISGFENTHFVLHMYYPASRGAQRNLTRSLGRLTFPYSLQFRLPLDAPPGFRVDVNLLDSLHAEHVIFQVKENHFYLFERKSFIEYFSSPNKFILLDESFGTGKEEEEEAVRRKILSLVSRGLSRIAVAGGFSAETAPRIHQLEDYFKIPISVDAETKLRSNDRFDVERARRYLMFFFPKR